MAGTNRTIDANATAAAGQHAVAFSLGFRMNSQDMSLWSYSVQARVPGLGKDHTFLENEGFGVAHACGDDASPANVCRRGFSMDYPRATFQFMATYAEDQAASGFYFGAHDPSAYAKTFQFVGIGGVFAPEDDGVVLPPFLRQDQSGGVMRVTAQPVGAGSTGEGSTFVSDFDVVVASFDGDWFDAAQVYRAWVMGGEADWIAGGLVYERDDFPQWGLDLTVWVNSHWQVRALLVCQSCQQSGWWRSNTPSLLSLFNSVFRTAFFNFLFLFLDHSLLTHHLLTCFFCRFWTFSTSPVGTATWCTTAWRTL